MQRRSFLTLLSGAAAAWPLAARAQQPVGMRRIGWLYVGADNDRVATAFRDGLASHGWIEGGNLRVDLRFGGDDLNRTRAHAADLVSLGPDVIATSSGATTRMLQLATQSIPIVFAAAGDPVANGLVQNIARPEGNTTGFAVNEPSVAGKWLGLLKEAAPQASRVAVILNPALAVTGPSSIASIEAAALALSVQAIATPVRDAVDIVHAIDAFSAAPNGGLIVLPPPPVPAHLEAIHRLAVTHRLPSVYGGRDSVSAGGLISYGADTADLSRRAATYVDRLLRGAKVIDLPVQFPTKYELVINLRTAKAIGLTIPEAFLLRADEVIE
jgi:ABC-type uncharacterized transport system substrate-binding protein